MKSDYRVHVTFYILHSTLYFEIVKRVCIQQFYVKIYICVLSLQASKISHSIHLSGR